jgi:probable LLM family oxidoreductase
MLAMAEAVEFGLDTFGDVTTDMTGGAVSQAQVIRNVVEEGVLADAVGLDFFGVGEHHRDDFAVTAPEMLLAAIAGRTKRIHLGSAVTVLSSDDPVRVFERFSSLNAISNGRAEVIVGRGSFTESFPLFGYPLEDYEKLFEEKLDLFAAILSNEPVSWSGETRAGLVDQSIFPRIEKGTLKTWVGVGGSPNSVIRAAAYGLPMMLAVIGGNPARFAPFSDLYRRALKEAGKPELPVGIHSPGHVAATDNEARERFFPHFKANRDRIGRDRGWPPLGRAEYDREVETGSLYVGSPETVARKMAATIKAIGANRFDLKYSAGTLPHDYSLDAIELYGRDVVPMVRELLA